MAMSSEYPDLKWMPPRAFGTGRDGKTVRYIVIHYTAGSERSTSAEDGAVNDQHRDDGVSTHYFVDRDSIIQCVRTRDRANAARHRGNRLGVQYELCGTAQTRAQWLDAASRATLQLAAKQVARDCRKYDIPVRRLSVAETRRAWTEHPNGPKGIVGHVDCTNAYPEDGGDHTDPGAAFPWDVFLDLVRAELAPPKEDVMPSAEEVADAVAGKLTPLLLQIQLAGRQTANSVLQGRQAADAADAADAERDALMTSLISKVDDEVYAHLRAGTPEATAAVLRAVLGDQAAEVGRLLAAA